MGENKCDKEVSDSKKKRCEEDIVENDMKKKCCDGCCGECKEEEQEKDSEDYKDKYLRLLADFSNFKNRIEAQGRQSIFMNQRYILCKLLFIFDDFNRCLENEKELEKDALQLVFRNFKSFFNEYNVTKIDIKVGDAFDSSIAEAVCVDDVDDESNDKKILNVYQNGYKIVMNDNGKTEDVILRHAKVCVGKIKKK